MFVTDGLVATEEEQAAEPNGAAEEILNPMQRAVVHNRVARVRGMLQAGVRQFGHCWPKRLYKLGTKAFVIWLVNNSRIQLLHAPPRSSIIMRLGGRVCDSARQTRARL